MNARNQVSLKKPMPKSLCAKIYIFNFVSDVLGFLFKLLVNDELTTRNTECI